jgi:hypothetical protein
MDGAIIKITDHDPMDVQGAPWFDLSSHLPLNSEVNARGYVGNVRYDNPRKMAAAGALGFNYSMGADRLGDYGSL